MALDEIVQYLVQGGMELVFLSMTSSAGFLPVEKERVVQAGTRLDTYSAPVGGVQPTVMT